MLYPCHVLPLVFYLNTKGAATGGGSDQLSDNHKIAAQTRSSMVGANPCGRPVLRGRPVRTINSQQVPDILLDFSVALISFPVVFHQSAAQYGLERKRNVWV